MKKEVNPETQAFYKKLESRYFKENMQAREIPSIAETDFYIALRGGKTIGKNLEILDIDSMFEWLTTNHGPLSRERALIHSQSAQDAEQQNKNTWQLIEQNLLQARGRVEQAYTIYHLMKKQANPKVN